MRLSGKIFLIICSLAITLKASITITITTPQGAHLCPDILESNQDYLLEITGKNIESLSNITLEGLDQWHARQQSSYTTINTLNNKTERSCQLTYHIKPKKEGDFVLGPACIMQQGVIIKSNTLQGTLIAGSKNNKVLNDHDQEIFLKMTVDYPRCYINQTLTLTAVLYIPLHMHIAECTTPIVLSDQSLHFSLIQQYPYKQRYHCIEWQAFIRPQKEGEVTVGVAELICMVQQPSKKSSIMQAALRSFGFGAEQKNIISNRLMLDVQSLPDNSSKIDAIGDFHDFSAQISDDTLSIHDALTYSITLKGPAAAIAHPVLHNVDDFRVHASQSSLQQASKTFEYILQPSKEGTLVIPEQQFCFLNPNNGSITTLSTKAFSVKVCSADKAPSVNHTEQSSLDTSIDIRLIDHAWQSVPTSKDSTLTLVFMMLLSIAFLIVPCIKSIRYHLSDIAWLRKKYALRAYHKALHHYDATHPEHLESMLKTLLRDYYGMSCPITTQQCHDFGRLFTHKHQEWSSFVNDLTGARYSFCTQSTALKLRDDAQVWLQLMKEHL